MRHAGAGRWHRRTTAALWLLALYLLLLYVAFRWGGSPELDGLA